MLEIHISGTKLTTISGAPDGAPQKTGPRNGEFAGESDNGALEVRGSGSAWHRTGHRAGRKKKKDPPPRPAVWCGAGIFCGAPKRTLRLALVLTPLAMPRMPTGGIPILPFPLLFSSSPFSICFFFSFHLRLFPFIFCYASPLPSPCTCPPPHTPVLTLPDIIG